MPVVDGVFEPRAPLTEAELHVDHLAHYHHVTDRRAAVEQAAVARAKRVAFHVATTGAAPAPQVDRLATALERSLAATARFGYASARAELAALRASQPARAEYTVPDAGDHAQAAAGGLQGVRDLIRQRAREAAQHVAAAALAAFSYEALVADADMLRMAVAQQTSRVLHNTVLELVGETLNLGRAAGAITLDRPPEFAFRSEQLDKATCPACESLHGTIAVVGSPDFYSFMPPSGCYGGGRCRGVWVFADGVSQVRGPDIEPTGPVPLPAEPGPVQFPRRRAA